MTKTKELIKNLNKAEEKLSPENKEIFDGVVLYFRSSNIKTKDIEEFLQQLLDSFLMAQNENKTIEKVLGTDDIKSYCKEIVDTFKSTYGKFDLVWQHIMYSGLVLSILFGTFFVTDTITNVIIDHANEFTFNMDITIENLVQVPIVVIMEIVAFAYMKHSAFKKSSKKDYLVLWLIFMCIISGWVVLDRFITKVVLFTIPIYIILAVLIAIYFVGKHFSVE